MLLFSIVCSQNISAASSHFVVSDLAQQLAGKRVTLVNSDIEITQIKGKGIKDTNASWTLSALKNFELVIEKILNGSQYEYFQQVQASDDEFNKLIALQRIVEKSILSNFQDPLPTKNNFDWSIGPIDNVLKKSIRADYGLFVFIRAGFISNISPADYQTGLISLVDLNSGKTVWFNAQTNLPNDLRHPDQSFQTLLALFGRFPGVSQGFK